MGNMNAIQRHLRLYKEQKAEWKPDHDHVMRQYDRADVLGEAVSYGMFLYERLQKQRPTTFEASRALYQGYLEWIELTLPLVRAVEYSENSGFEVEGSEEILKTFDEVNSLTDKISRRIEALDAFIDGRGIPAEQFIASL